MSAQASPSASPHVVRAYAEPDRPVVPAPVLLVVAALLFALMAVVARRAAAALPGPEVAFVRFCLGLLACLVASMRIRMRAKNQLGLLLRGAYGGAAVLLYFLAIAHLPVGVATLLNYTAPVFTAIYAAIFLGEKVRPAAVAALAITTTGVVLVMKGTAAPGSLGFGIWQMVGLGSAVLSGAAVAMIREVRKTDGSWEIFAAFCLGGALITLVPTWKAWVRPTLAGWIALGLVGLFSLGAQLLMTYALRFVRAAVAGIIAQLTPVAALAMGWLFLGEAVAVLAILGAGLTLIGVSWGAYLAATPEPVAVEEP